MPTLVLDVPAPLYDRIQEVALRRKLTLAQVVLEVLETAFQTVTPTSSELPPPGEIFLSPKIPAPFDIPRPEGKPTRAVKVSPPLPSAHDFPTEE